MSERDGWNHLYLYDGATGAVKNQITKGDWVVRGVAAGRRDEAPDLVQRRRHVSRQGSVLRPLLPDQLRRHGPDAAHDGRRAITRVAFSPDMQVLRRHLLARRPARRSSSCAGRPMQSLVMRRSRRGDITRARRRRAGRRRRCSSPRAATARPTSGASSSARRNFDPTKKYPVIENIYAGPQGSFVPKTFAAYNADAVAWPSSASSSCRSTAWARRTARRRSTMSRGRTSATPASPIASSGTRRSPRSIRGTTSRASASTATRPAARTRSAALLFHPEFYKVARRRTPAATTTGWTRSGGTSSGWDGRSARSTRRRRTSTTRTGCRASCCWSSASWTPTSIRRRRCRWSMR